MERYAADLLRGVGYPEQPAQATAAHLVAADLMGHTTHGLALLPPYLTEAAEGRTTLTGTHEVVSDAGAVCVWDGGYRPGVWLTAQAVADAAERAASTVSASSPSDAAATSAVWPPIWRPPPTAA